jgi:hypothetical protein
MCEKCNCWETITKSHFKQMFKTSFWRWHKAYCDQFVYGGWKGRKNSERAKISLGRKLMKGFGI